MADYIYDRIVHRERGRVAFRTSPRSGQGNPSKGTGFLRTKRRRILGSSAMFRRDFFHGCLNIYIYIYVYARVRMFRVGVSVYARV